MQRTARVYKKLTDEMTRNPIKHFRHLHLYSITIPKVITPNAQMMINPVHMNNSHMSQHGSCASFASPLTDQEATAKLMTDRFVAVWCYIRPIGAIRGLARIFRTSDIQVCQRLCGLIKYTSKTRREAYREDHCQGYRFDDNVKRVYRMFHLNTIS